MRLKERTREISRRNTIQNLSNCVRAVLWLLFVWLLTRNHWLYARLFRFRKVDDPTCPSFAGMRWRIPDQLPLFWTLIINNCIYSRYWKARNIGTVCFTFFFFLPLIYAFIFPLCIWPLHGFKTYMGNHRPAGRLWPAPTFHAARGTLSNRLEKI